MVRTAHQIGMRQPGGGGDRHISQILLTTLTMNKRSSLRRLLLPFFVLLFFVLSFSHCTKKTTEIIYRDTTLNVTKDTTIVLDSSNQQTYILFLVPGNNTFSTSPVFAGELPFFDKTRYPGADSIIFYISGFNYNNSGPAGSFSAELYDATDNQVVPGSQVTVSDVAPNAGDVPVVFHASANVLAALPAKPIELQILVSSSASDNSADAGEAFLLIYK